MISVAGLPGATAADGDRTCRGWYRNSSLGKVPLRRVSCQTFPTAPSVQRPKSRDIVHIDRLTRRTTHVFRSWEVADSVAWHIAQDSINRALSAHGGGRAECAPVDRRLSNLRSRSAWRFDGYYIRMTAYRMDADPGEPEWVLQIDAYPGWTAGCGAPSA